MDSALHRQLVPLAETTLAILRLSCERFFMLISVFVAYLLFRGQVPQWLRSVIRLNHSLSKAFQKVILRGCLCYVGLGCGSHFSIVCHGEQILSCQTLQANKNPVAQVTAFETCVPVGVFQIC